MSAATPWDCALRYLGQRSHSAHELQSKLARRGFTEEEIDQTMQRLDDAGLLDDEQFADEYSESLFGSKNLSSREVARRLKQRGVSQLIIEATLAGSALRDYDRALVVGKKKCQQMADLPEEVQLRRLLAYLSRRGFTESICYAVWREMRDTV